MEEIEAKMLEVDVAELEKRLVQIGAERIGEYSFRIHNFDFPGYPLRQRHAWVRLRTDGEHPTLTYKQQHDSRLEEIETPVGDFDTARAFLTAIGMIEKHAQEKKRVTWKKGGITYDIDTWPLLPPFLEVEGESWEAVQRAIEELGYDWEKRLVCDASRVYDHYGIPWNSFKKIGFDEQVRKGPGEE